MTNKAKDVAQPKAEGKATAKNVETKVEPSTTAKGTPQLVKVRSVCKEWLRQPSSGTVINAKSEADLLNDGWLANQITAGFLELV